VSDRFRTGVEGLNFFRFGLALRRLAKRSLPQHLASLTTAASGLEVECSG